MMATSAVTTTTTTAAAEAAAVEIIQVGIDASWQPNSYRGWSHLFLSISLSLSFSHSHVQRLFRCYKAHCSSLSLQTTKSSERERELSERSESEWVRTPHLVLTKYILITLTIEGVRERKKGMKELSTWCNLSSSFVFVVMKLNVTGERGEDTEWREKRIVCVRLFIGRICSDL